MPKGIYPRKPRSTSSTQDSQSTQSTQNAHQDAPASHQGTQDAPEGPESRTPLRERVSSYVDTIEQRLAELAAQIASIESTAEREHQLRGESFALADIASELRTALASAKGEPSSGAAHILCAALTRCHARAERLAESQTRASQDPTAHHYSVLGAHHAAGQAREYAAARETLAALLDGCEPACPEHPGQPETL